MVDGRQSWSPPVFRPSLLWRSGHAQTIRAAIDAPRIPYTARQHTIETTHGDRLVLHDDSPAGWTGGEVALLAHGLGGCHGSPYMVRIAHKLQARGVRTFRMDLRGCGAGGGVARYPGHAGRSEDVDAVVRFLQQLVPDSPIVLIGFSLGANIVLKFLGEAAHAELRTRIARALAVAPPIDLMACALQLERWRRWTYNRWFVRALMRELQRRREQLPDTVAVDWNRPPRSLREFDDRVTAPWSGFRDVADYYGRSSAKPLLADIQTPTAILAADDDPVVPAAIFDDIELPPHIQLHRTTHGGHVGYFGRTNGDPDGYWMDWRVVEFVLLR